MTYNVGSRGGMFVFSETKFLVYIWAQAVKRDLTTFCNVLRNTVDSHYLDLPYLE